MYFLKNMSFWQVSAHMSTGIVLVRSFCIEWSSRHRFLRNFDFWLLYIETSHYWDVTLLGRHTIGTWDYWDVRLLRSETILISDDSHLRLSCPIVCYLIPLHSTLFSTLYSMLYYYTIDIPHASWASKMQDPGPRTNVFLMPSGCPSNTLFVRNIL